MSLSPQQLQALLLVNRHRQAAQRRELAALLQQRAVLIDREQELQRELASLRECLRNAASGKLQPVELRHGYLHAAQLRERVARVQRSMELLQPRLEASRSVLRRADGEVDVLEQLQREVRAARAARCESLEQQAIDETFVCRRADGLR